MQTLIKNSSMLISSKIDLKAKKITRDKGGHYNDKKINPPGRHNNSKCVCTK